MFTQALASLPNHIRATTMMNEHRAGHGFAMQIGEEVLWLAFTCYVVVQAEARRIPS